MTARFFSLHTVGVAVVTAACDSFSEPTDRIAAIDPDREIIDGGNASCPEGVGLSSATGKPIAEAGVIPSNDVVAIGSSQDHTCVVHQTGRVSCYGLNRYGQLGDGSFSDSVDQVEVLGLTDAVQVVAADGYSCALRSNGTVACWGDGAFATASSDEIGLVPSPVPICGVREATGIASAGYFSCAVLTEGTLRCWGMSDWWMADFPEMTHVASVGVGPVLTCVARSSGSINCWGLGSLGFLTGDPETPATVEGVNDAIAIGADGGCALRNNGNVACWVDAQGDFTLQATPIDGLKDVVALAGNGMCALLANGQVACWEMTALTDDRVGAPFSVQLRTIDDLDDAVALSGNCAVRATGEVQCW